MTAVVQNTVMMNFTSALHIMVLGMTGIFLFMGVIYLLIYGLEVIFKDWEEK